MISTNKITLDMEDLKKKRKKLVKKLVKNNIFENIYLHIQVFLDLQKNSHPLSIGWLFKIKTSFDSPFLFHYIMGAYQRLALIFHT